MKYCINTQTCIFTRFTEKKFALSSQEFKIIKNGCLVCPKKFIEETKNKYPLTLKFENLQLSIYDVVLEKDIIYFYFETDNPDSITLDKIYQNKKFPIVADGKQTKQKCNMFVPSVQDCSLLPTAGGYSIHIEINGQSLIVTIDTGSSTLGVPTDPYIKLKPKDFYGSPLPTYKPAKDRCFKTTDYLTYAQYGSGSWGGSNIISKVEVGSKRLDYMQFAAAYFVPNTESAIYEGGILGFAYPLVTNVRINYGKKSYPPTPEMLTQQFWDKEKQKPYAMYPTFMDYYGQKYSNYSQKCALYVKRVYVSSLNEEYARNEHTNYGWFILGGGESLTNFYHGELSVIPVIKTPPNSLSKNKNDQYVWYTIQLNNFKINSNNIDIPKEYFTVIDSGTIALDFPNYFYDKIKTIFTSIKIPLNCDGTGNFWDKYTFEYVTDRKPIEKAEICLEKWPTVYFPLTDINGNEKIFTISPKNYWNLSDNIYLFFLGFLDLPVIILGHPFLCENYCVFDYGQKQVKIAPRN